MSSVKKPTVQKRSKKTPTQNLLFEKREGCDWLTAKLKSGKTASICLQHLELSASATRVFKQWAREQ